MQNQKRLGLPKNVTQNFSGMHIDIPKKNCTHDKCHNYIRIMTAPPYLYNLVVLAKR